MLIFFTVSVIMNIDKIKRGILKDAFLQLIGLMNFFEKKIHFQYEGVIYGLNDISLESTFLSFKQIKPPITIENFKEPVLITRIKNINEKPKILSYENLDIDQDEINKFVYKFLSNIFVVKKNSSGTSNLIYKFKCPIKKDTTYKKHFIDNDSDLSFQPINSKDIFYCCIFFLTFKQIITTLNIDENSNYIKEFIEQHLIVDVDADEIKDEAFYKKKTRNRCSVNKLKLDKVLRRVGIEVRIKKYFFYNNEFQPKFYPNKDPLLYTAKIDPQESNSKKIDPQEVDPEKAQPQMHLQTFYIFECLVDFIELAVQLRYAIDNTYMHESELLRLSIKHLSVDDIFNLKHENILVFIFNLFFNYLYLYGTEGIIVCAYCGNLYPEKRLGRKFCEGSHCRQKNNKMMKGRYKDILKNAQKCIARQKLHIDNKNSTPGVDTSKDIILIKKYCEGCIKRSFIDEKFQFPESGDCLVIPFLSANIERISPSEDLIAKFNGLPEEIKKKFLKPKEENEVTLKDLLEQVLNSEENKK